MKSPLDEKLSQFVEDDVMFNAVRGFALSQCNLNNLYKKNAKFEYSNAQLLEMGRAWWQAREIIENTFKDLQKYRKITNTVAPNTNPAV